MHDCRIQKNPVIDNSDNILGIITDGDLRRMLEKNIDFSKLTAKDIMTANPKSISVDMLAADALQLMESKNITQLIVEENNKYVGFVHLHDILKEGIL